MIATPKASVYWLQHLQGDGATQMAMDEALLQWVKAQPEAMILARTYTWQPSTLSVGVHQSQKSIQKAYQFYALSGPIDVVRRPTGGRAIWHHNDVSFAFITNVPSLLNCRLSDSYCFFTQWVKAALLQCGVPLAMSCEAGERDYVMSALCFETKTPSDLVTTTGEKIAGSAQLRQKNGILQHGAAFLERFGVSPSEFDAALKKAAEADYPGLKNQKIEDLTNLETLLEKYRKQIQAESASILTNAATTIGSHFTPASP